MQRFEITSINAESVHATTVPTVKQTLKFYYIRIDIVYRYTSEVETCILELAQKLRG